MNLCRLFRSSFLSLFMTTLVEKVDWRSLSSIPPPRFNGNIKGGMGITSCPNHGRIQDGCGNEVGSHFTQIRGIILPGISPVTMCFRPPPFLNLVSITGRLLRATNIRGYIQALLRPYTPTHLLPPLPSLGWGRISIHWKYGQCIRVWRWFDTPPCVVLLLIFDS